MILLDTHALIWMLMEPEQLSQAATQAILTARVRGERLACSQVSLYEIATAARRRRINLKVPVQDFLDLLRVRVDFVPLTAEIAVCAGEIPEPFHGDPMDRIITATALLGGYDLVTCDGKIGKSGLCRVIW